MDVIPYNREFIKTNQDTAFLKQMADESGGEYFNYDEVDNLFSQMDLEHKKIRIEDEVELRYKAWFMYLIIGLAITEWTFRKIKNLA